MSRLLAFAAGFALGVLMTGIDATIEYSLPKAFYGDTLDLEEVR